MSWLRSGSGFGSSASTVPEEAPFVGLKSDVSDEDPHPVRTKLRISTIGKSWFIEVKYC